MPKLPILICVLVRVPRHFIANHISLRTMLRTMYLIEIFSLCGIVQIITASYLFGYFRAHVPTQHLKYLVSCSQCMGFWVGVTTYAAVALSTPLPGMIYAFPLASAVAATHNPFIQWGMVLMLGGLISIISILVNHVIELLFYGKMYLLMQVENDMVTKANVK